MFKSIFSKEWLKIKFYFILLLCLVCISQIYFFVNISFDFSVIEPESMLWYKFAHLYEKPYFSFVYLYLIIGLVVSFVQYIPERIHNRIKIMAHLPLKLRDSLYSHLFIGIIFIAILCLILSLSLILIMNEFYPDVIIKIILKDTVVYSVLSVVLYLGISAVILEKKPLLTALKFIFVSIIVFSFLKEQYTLNDIVLVVFLFFMPFLVLDSFYSIKEQRLTSIYFRFCIFLVTLLLLYIGYLTYNNNYKKEFNKYYIFYSNIINDFVYQKNYGKHKFEYGIKNSSSFSRAIYESYLPFVYWRNLDIQGKLPLDINKNIYSKKIIKTSRLGFSYHPEFLKDLEVNLYPLFNPLSHKGMIKYPEEMFIISSNGAVVYNFDEGVSQKLTQELNIKLLNNNFSFPAKHIWGKPTNMKPFDKGYLVLDNKSNLFNIQRDNSIIRVIKVNYPKNINLKFMKISENKQKKLAGYAIDSQSNFYLLDWNFNFNKIDLPNFDYKKMKLKLISNPINYLIRYDDSSSYYAVSFKKNDGFKQIKYIEVN